jgi:hypothetical protein
MSTNKWLQASNLLELANAKPRIWKLIIGQKVKHSNFGKGEVLSLGPAGDPYRHSWANINFEKQSWDSDPTRIALTAFNGTLITEVLVPPDLAKEMDAYYKSKEPAKVARSRQRLHESSQALPNADNHEKTKYFLAKRNIQSLVHVTTMKNWLGIMKEGAILSRRILDDNKLQYKAFDTERWDGAIRYVNCSITYYNFHMFYREIKSKQSEYVQLLINPDFLWKLGTQVCRENAAARTALHTEASIGLESLFDQQVVDVNGIHHTRRDKPDNLPTCIQAEVLVREGIPLKDIQKVLVPNSDGVGRARSPEWNGLVEINSKAFAYHRKWWTANSSR